MYVMCYIRLHTLVIEANYCVNHVSHHVGLITAASVHIDLFYGQIHRMCKIIYVSKTEATIYLLFSNAKLGT